jgi:hypothetical protein
LVRRGRQAQRLFWSQSGEFSLDDGSWVRFHLVDAHRLEDSVCGQAPAMSIGYLVRPL